MSAPLSYGRQSLASPLRGDTVNQHLWRHMKQPCPSTSWGRRRKSSPCHLGLKIPAKEHTDFSWKTGDLVFWQIQNPHGLKQFYILRNDLNQSIADVPFFQMCLLLQRIWELLE